MIYIWLNALPILAATVAGLLVGWLYHRLFGRASGGRPTAGFMLTAFLAQAWFAAILAGALILAPKQAGVWVMAIGSAVLIWVGFMVPAVIVTQRYRGVKPVTVTLDCFYWLAVMVVQAVVMQAIGLEVLPA